VPGEPSSLGSCDLDHRCLLTRVDPIAVYCDNRSRLVGTLFATWTTGAMVVPIDPQLTGAGVHTRLAAANAARRASRRQPRPRAHRRAGRSCPSTASGSSTSRATPFASQVALPGSLVTIDGVEAFLDRE
jgi:long-subunit acyl-CoA synthetase (AMP-forming)